MIERMFCLGVAYKRIILLRGDKINIIHINFYINHYFFRYLFL